MKKWRQQKTQWWDNHGKCGNFPLRPLFSRERMWPGSWSQFKPRKWRHPWIQTSLDVPQDWWARTEKHCVYKFTWRSDPWVWLRKQEVNTPVMWTGVQRKQWITSRNAKVAVVAQRIRKTGDFFHHWFHSVSEDIRRGHINLCGAGNLRWWWWQKETTTATRVGSRKAQMPTPARSGSNSDSVFLKDPWSYL